METRTINSPFDYMCENCVTPWRCNGPHLPYDESREGYGFLAFKEEDGSLTATVREELDKLPLYDEPIDIINKPPHYRNHASGVECIQITEHMNFCLGNAMKYIWRAGDKHETPLEDLKKAKWYIEREIQRLEKL